MKFAMSRHSFTIETVSRPRFGHADRRVPPAAHASRSSSRVLIMVSSGINGWPPVPHRRGELFRGLSPRSTTLSERLHLVFARIDPTGAMNETYLRSSLTNRSEYASSWSGRSDRPCRKALPRRRSPRDAVAIARYTPRASSSPRFDPPLHFLRVVRSRCDINPPPPRSASSDPVPARAAHPDQIPGRYGAGPLGRESGPSPRALFTSITHVPVSAHRCRRRDARRSG